ncbi:glycosyltransferase family 2 protein [Rhodoblastus acidophilus]|nr:glycosyltransferase family 2 protein [Rhodoblastus acidophilus]
MTSLEAHPGPERPMTNEGVRIDSATRTPVGYFSIVSFHGTYVVVSRAERSALVVPAEISPTAQFVPLYGCIFESRPGKIVLIAEQPAREFSIGAERFAQGMAWLTLETLEGGLFHLRHPSTGRYLCAFPRKGNAAEPVQINRLEAREWESFRLEALAPETISAPTREIVELLARNEGDLISADAIKTAFRAPAGNLGAVVKSFSVAEIQPEQLAALSDWLVKSDDWRQGLPNLYPRDPWAHHALPRLTNWLRESPTERGKWPRFERVTADFDPVATRDMAISAASLPFVLNAVTRRNVEPSKEICLIATVRNEGPYLLEWLAWHRCLGIEDVFVYSNDNTDNSDSLLAALAHAGLITWLENSEHGATPPQFKAYGHALSVLPQILNYRWAAIIDADEFIMLDFDAYKSLGAYLAWQEEVAPDAIALNWNFFGANGQQTWADELTVRRFVSRQAETNRHIKTIFRSNKFLNSHCHYPIAMANENINFVNECRSPHIYSVSRDPSICDFPSATHAWINHYYTRSAGEFIWKKARGYGDRIANREHLFADFGLKEGRLQISFSNALNLIRETGQVPDERALERAVLVDQEMVRLLSDPAIRAAHDAVIEYAGAGIKLAVDAFRALPAEIMPDDLKQIWLSAAGADVRA